MDLDSLELIARLNAQSEFMDMNEEDAQIESNEEETEVQGPTQSHTQIQPATQTQTTRKRRKTSPVWNDFVSVGFESDGKERASCIHCSTKLVVSSTKGENYGTHHLTRHLDTCPKMPKKIDKPAYDQKVDSEMTSEVIIYHDLPFRYVEFEKVRARDRYLNPDVQPICRQTAASDVFSRFVIEKEKLKEVFAKHQGRVCFTSDLWTARATVMGYICLTAHFIDDRWNLNSKILAFCDLKSPHTGENIANRVLECLKEWGLEKKVFSITLDNAKNNDSMQRILMGRLQMMSGSGLLCDGKFMHVRCCAHILNLIVKKCLDLAKDVLHNIRESVRYVKASSQRREAFAACVERVGIKSGAGLSLDVPTRWNSTYEMLARALKFRAAFVSMKVFDTNYKFLPSEDEWNRGEKICDLLKPFSVITTYFSGSKYPTSNVYFTQVWRIESLLKKYTTCGDDAVEKVAQEMKVKFSEYWDDYSLILAIGAVFDPRHKLKMLEVAYKKVDPITCQLKTKELEKNLRMLYKAYQTSSSSVSTTPRVSTIPLDLLTESPLEDYSDNDLFELEKSIEDGVNHSKTHLDIYLNEPRLEWKSFPNLDVLSYWRDNQHRLGDLATMACEVLSIPITTVASESAFSIGSRVLTPYRNRLLPQNVQALLCTRNWLRGFVDYEGTIEDTENFDLGDARKTSSSSRVESSRLVDSSVP